MQTFLPYPDFARSVALLDSKRLGKQRVETYQVLKAFKGLGGLHGGWSRHPAARMWWGYDLALLRYQEATIDEWRSRGFNDTCWDKSLALFTAEELKRYKAGDYAIPSWIGDPKLHETHRSILSQKAPALYQQLFAGDTRQGLAYIWPGPSLEEAKRIQGVSV